MKNLEELFLRHNRITYIPTELSELENLNEFVIETNQITELPIEIVNLENLTYFQYHDNPIDNLLNPVIQRFIQRFNNNYRHTHTLYTDSQNIHASSIQQHTKDSIYNLIKQMEKSYDYDYINDPELSDNCKEALVEYSEDKTIHSQLECNFKDILMAVFYEISQLPKDTQTFAKQRLNEEMLDSECKCFTGRITRLVNSLSSISDKVIIKISDSEEIGNIITVARGKFKDIEEIKEYVRKDLKERGYTEDVINEWVAYIE
jgi:Leucine-rich repeat (LRR) protein